MEMRRWRAVLVAFALCWMRLSLACPPNCLSSCRDTEEESCSGILCSCHGLGWTVIPPLSNQSVILSFALTGAYLSHISGHVFSVLADLEVLVLTNNSIRSLGPFTFQGLSKVATLNLSDNALARIDAGDFEALTSLERLDLSRNSISYVAIGAFQGLGKLQTLNLSQNNISQLHPDMFAGLPDLRSLFLSYNSIKGIAANTFQNLQRLRVLHLSHNAISDYDPWALNGTRNMTSLALSYNRLSRLPAMFTQATPTLQYLELAGNNIVSLNQSQFAPGKQLRSLELGEMHHLTAVLPNAFAELPLLESVNISYCPRLAYVNAKAFLNCVSLQRLDLRNSGLQSLRQDLISSLTSLRQLYLDHNQWWCNCSSHWLAAIKDARPDLFGSSPNVTCSKPELVKGRSVFDFDNYRDNCTNATIASFASLVSFRIDSTALLECQVEGDPAPSITWSTPKNGVRHWSPDDKEQLALLHSTDKMLPEIIPRENSGRVRVLKNGNLFISNVKIEDAGIYTCVADNSLGNQSASMRMILDYEILVQVKVVSILVGFATSVAFLLTMLVGQLVHMILNRWGWCCCRGKLSPKAKRVRKMLESIEHYKKQQLDRLRENYNMQVQRIKDNGTQQMEWLRESYYSQSDKLRDIRDYGTLQIDRMRDQYYDQVRRVRDYSVQQMSRVRENYVSQRNRIRKFSAHQLFKLRENYKVQQMHLNKILENLNLESCRTVCARTDSVMFTSEITMDPTFVQGRVVKPIRLDGSLGSSDSSDFGLPDSVEMGQLMLPLELEEYELRPLNQRGSGATEMTDEEKGMPPLTLPVLLLHQDLPTVHESGDRHYNEGERVIPNGLNCEDVTSREGECVISAASDLDEVWVVTGATSPGFSPRMDENAVAV